GDGEPDRAPSEAPVMIDPRRQPPHARPTTCRDQPAAHPRGRWPDGGFTLAEVLVAISLVGTMMAALTPFFVNVLASTDHQRTRQVAIQLTGDAIERARALKGSALLAGRGRAASEAQWDAAPDTVEPYLDRLTLGWDPLVATGAGADAPLPTEPLPVTIADKRYEQHWYVGSCQQQGGPTGSADRDCAPVDPADADPRPNVPMYGLVVAVTWTHRACPAEQCVYVATTLFSNASDPVFNSERPPPAVNVGDQYGYVGQAVSLQLTATGGRLPLSWAVTGLPPGLTLFSAASGVVSGTPTTANAYTVRVTVTDQAADSDTRQFTWHIAQPLALADPSDQNSVAGTAVSVPFASYRTGGHASFTWSATNLPAGLTMDAATGVVSGRPTGGTRPTNTVRITVTDRTGRTASAELEWTVAAGVNGATLVTPMGDAVPAGLKITPSAGVEPYSDWSAENLPPGLTINSATGVISGSPDHGTRYLTTVYATDSHGSLGATTFVWQVPPDKNNDMHITAPDPGNPDRTIQVDQADALNVAADKGSNSGYTWTADDLPPGLTLTHTGDKTALVSGRPTVAGRYQVRITAVDSNSKRATIMFIWTVTP
ncbi:MAG TPA: putative Ig domain-containing protein, partial [Micromonosporaceae bacterium]|nr:putative Ig domain-containing protein [Micromonosporaceae bacterium]